MLSIININLWLTMISISQGSISYNQPELCPNSQWNSSATTFVDESVIGSSPYSIFINTSNNIYILNQKTSQIYIWYNDSNYLSVPVVNSNWQSYSLFSANNGTIYVSSNDPNNSIYKWTWNMNTSVAIINNENVCYNIFVDINDSIYCSLSYLHKVVKRSLNNIMNTSKLVAGIGCSGFTSNMLFYPRGLFVHKNLSLYVADCGNDRIQFFEYNQLNGTTLVGNIVQGITILNCPSGIMLDSDDYLYIVDQNNNRIQRTDLNEFTCLVGCSINGGPSSVQLNQPQSMAFDSFGNIFVTDQANNRIQKLMLIMNSCDEKTTLQQTTTLQETTTLVAHITNDQTDPTGLNNFMDLTTSPIKTTISNYSNPISYNRPTLNALATWSTNAITLGSAGQFSNESCSIFIDTNNTVYVVSRTIGAVQAWINGSTNFSSTIVSNLSYPLSLFVSSNGDIYIDNGYPYNRVVKWSSNMISRNPIMNVSQQCYGLFIDSNNTLYCSIMLLNQVVARSLSDESDSLRIVAGTGCTKLTSYNLNYPYGIFVNTNFDLYVADCGNNRVQLFHLGQINATTVAGSGARNTVSLSCPTDVVLDNDNHLYIVDKYHHRIVRSGPIQFSCVVGCFGGGSAPNQLNQPQSMAFDSYGNIFVMDTNNNRIQKFLLLTNSCDVIQTSTINTPDTSVFTSLHMESTTVFSQSTSAIGTPKPSNNQNQTVSYNQPRLDPLATWSANGLTWARSNLVGSYPYSIFINTNNTIYVTNRANGRIQIWFENNVNYTKNVSGNGTSNPYGLFVTINNDIYIDNGYQNDRVDKWTLNASVNVLVMTVEQECYGLFVDSSNTLYCSVRDFHKVVAKSLNNGSQEQTTIAGTGCPGTSSSMLFYPSGLFVDNDLNLYVADCGNNRIQLFSLGQSYATTVPLIGIPQGFTLNCPTGITFDANKYLFIVDSGNHRILGSSPKGFRCILGCFPLYYSLQLYYPQSIAFDTHGNIFVADTGFSRIQKFILLNNSNIATYNQPKFCPSVNWNLSAVTLSTTTMSMSQPYGIFIDKNDTIYIACPQSNQIFIWTNENLNNSDTIYLNGYTPYTIFTTSIGDVYVSEGNLNTIQIDRWNLNTTNHTNIMSGFGSCYDIFIDVTNTIYCSIYDYNQVVKKWLNDGTTASAVIAGQTNAGSSSNQLNSPRGIFVDINFNLYVADSGNNRVQLFLLGQQYASTVAGGNVISNTIALQNPTGVILDGSNYLFIVDSGNNRIVASGPMGFRCIIGCFGSGSSSSQLNSPQSMSFDSVGNIYVTDRNNNRVQKFALATNSCTISYNQPKFSPCATWDPNSTTIASMNTVGTQPVALFVNAINTVYMVNQNTSQILVWPQGNQVANRTVNRTLSAPKSLFVSIIGDIYIDTGYNRVDIWISNATNITSVTVMNTTGSCHGLFIDTKNTLYCSIPAYPQVVKVLLKSNTTVPRTIAGNGSNGSGPYLLRSPQGIFVDTDFSLYVADCGNDRVQLFHPNQSNGTTIVGNGSTQTISINCPTAIILDADKQFFILDSNNHRIIQIGLESSRCLVGCSSTMSFSYQLDNPRSLNFDSYGNMFVADRDNNSIQQFFLATNSCDEYTTTQQTTSDQTSIDSTTSISSTSESSRLSSVFIPPVCSDKNRIGHDCNTSSTPCDILQPCQNQGICTNTNTTPLGFNCTCSDGFLGAQCQYDRRPCKPNTCWNNGTCNQTSNTTFECICKDGWIGQHCELKKNYCENVVCLNNGVCRPLFMNYTCDCLGESYSGRHCEIVATSRVVLQTVTKSLGYIAIISLVIVIGFFVVMDVLKYCFGIDPAKDELERIRRANAIRRAKKRRPVIQKFRYVNAPPEQ